MDKEKLLPLLKAFVKRTNPLLIQPTLKALIEEDGFPEEDVINMMIACGYKRPKATHKGCSDITGLRPP